MKNINKAAEIRTLLAEGVDVATISKKLHIPKPYVIQVRWHWKKAGSPPPKKAKPQPKKLFIQPQHLDKAVELLKQKTETFSDLFGAALPKQEGEPAKFDWSSLMFEEEKAQPGQPLPVDLVNSPSHYTVGGIETIDFIEAKGLNYNLGNVVKYITRADHKGKREQDLKKALWYLNREIENLSGW